MSDRVPIAEAVEKVTKEENAKAQTQPSNKETMGVAENIEYHRVADFMEIDYNERQDPELAKKIDYVYKWGQTESGSEDRLQALLAIKNAIKGLGMTEKGKDMITKLYKWMRLDSSRKRIEQEMQLV